MYDIVNFDMIMMIRLPYTPACAAWIYQTGEAKAKLAVADAGSNKICIYDTRSGSKCAPAPAASP